MKKHMSILLLATLLIQLPIKADHHDNHQGIGSKAWNLTKIIVGGYITYRGARGTIAGFLIPTEKIIERLKEEGLKKKKPIAITPLLANITRGSTIGIYGGITVLGYKILQSGVNGLRGKDDTENPQIASRSDYLSR